MSHRESAHVFTRDDDRDHLRLLLRIARLYWIDGLDQKEVAAAVGYSRPTVSRLLAQARARGIVTVQVSHPVESALACETRLRSRFGLTEAAVALDRGGGSAAAVGGIAARLIVRRGGERAVVALSNGSSLSALVSAMPPQRWPGSHVVQMIGAIAGADTDAQLVDSPELCRRLADRLGGAHRPLPVPIVVSSATMARAMAREESVRTTLELAARADIAACGVGAVDADGSSGRILRAYATPAVDAEVRRGGAVAHLAGHHFDARGRHVPTSLCERLIALDPARLADVAVSLAVAWGREKVAALHAILRTGYVNALATDEPTARALLDFRP